MEDSRATFRFKDGRMFSVVYDFKNHNGKWETYKTKKWTGTEYKIKDLRVPKEVKKERDKTLYYSKDAKEVLGIND